MKFFFYLALLFFLSFEVQAEYIVMEENKEGNLTPFTDYYIFQKIDYIKSIYQFPLNLNPLHRTNLEMLTSDQRNLMDTDERLFLEEMINAEIAPRKIRLLYIPTTLYELYVIGNGVEISLKSEAQDDLVPTFNSADLIRSNPKSLREISAIYQNAVYNNISYRHRVNKNLGIMLSKIRDPLPSQKKLWKEDGWKSLQQEMLEQHQLFYEKNKKTVDWYSMLFSDREHPIDPYFSCSPQNLFSFLQNAIEVEFLLHQEGKVPLYRGSQNLEEDVSNPSSTHRYTNPGWSLSYGRTLFSGFNTEERNSTAGAAAWSYMVNIDYMAKRIFFTRKDIVDGQVSLFVPPLDTLTGMLSAGEFFHPRTLLGKDLDTGGRCKGLACSLDTLVAKEFIFSKTKTQKEIQEEIEHFPLLVIKAKSHKPLQKVLKYGISIDPKPPTSCNIISIIVDSQINEKPKIKKAGKPGKSVSFSGIDTYCPE